MEFLAWVKSLLDGIVDITKSVTDWLVELVKSFFNALFEFFQDVLIWCLDAVLSVVATLVEAIPVPDFMGSGGLGSLFGQLDGSVLYFVDRLNVAEGLAMIGAAVAFRLARKAATLFQW